MPELEPIVQPINSNYNPAGMLSFLGHLGAVPGVAMVAAAAIVAVGGATVDAVKKTIDWGLALDDVMDKIGGTTEEAAGLKLISDAVGMSVDDATRSLNLMGKNLETTEGKIGSSGKALDELNIEFRNADGTFRDSIDIFKDVSTVLNAMPDGLTKTRYEMEIFGRSGASMNDMLRNAADGGMQKFIDQAKAMGLALSPDQVTGIEKLSENMNIMKDQFTGIAVILGSAFIPAVQAAVTWIANLVAGVTPAIQHFGTFLGQLLGVQGAASGAASAISGGGAMQAPAGGNALINYNFWANQPHPAGSVNPYGVQGAGGGMGIPAGGTVTQGHGATDFKATGFELAVKDFVDGIKTVDWQQVAADFKAAGATIGEVITTIDTLLNSPTAKAIAAGLNTVMTETGTGGQFSGPNFADTFGAKISDFFAPKFDKQWTDQADQTLKIIEQGAKQQQAINDAKKTNDTLNTTMKNLPGQIKAAIQTANRK